MNAFATRVYPARVRHERISPTPYVFEHALPICILDLDELDELDRRVLLFGHNRFRLAAFHDADYLTRGEAPAKAKLLTLASEHGLLPAADHDDDDASIRVLLVTAARWLGYVFNPVSFHFAFAADGALRFATAEVNNTFGEKHVYMLGEQARLPAPEAPPGTPAREKTETWRFTTAKAFHVSPFNDMTGEYRFRFADPRERLDLGVELYREGELAFTARLWSDAAGEPLGDRQLLRQLARHPLQPGMTYPRILRHALALRRRKGLRVHAKPIPTHGMTLRQGEPAAANAVSRALGAPRRMATATARRAALAYLRPLRGGRLVLREPDGKTHALGDGSGPEAVLDVTPSFYTRTVLGGGVGFGEAFVDGDWDAPPEMALNALRLLAVNMERLSLARTLNAPPWAARFVTRMGHLPHWRGRRNDRPGAQANIHAHYDLSDALFESFLDPTMAYSCALFETPAQSLEEAQRAKFRRIRELAGLSDDGAGRVLEIGCGWGGFAESLLRNTRCDYVGITISRNQYAYTKRRLEQAGLADRADVRFLDFRDLPALPGMAAGFDAVVSIEMLEAVGHANHPAFFRTVEAVLAPTGRTVHQVITIRDQRYAASLARPDWIRKWIFPGGLLPSLSRLAETARDHTELVIREVHDIGAHYGPTLARWRERFLARFESLRPHGFDERFRRLWLYYLLYCQAGFEAGVISDIHIALERPPLAR